MANSYQEQARQATEALTLIKGELVATDQELMKLISHLNQFNGIKTPSGISNGLSEQVQKLQQINNLFDQQKQRVSEFNKVKESSIKLAEKAYAEEQKKQKQVDSMFTKRQSQINKEIASEEKKQAEIRKAYNERDKISQRAIEQERKAQSIREAQVNKESALRERLNRQREKEEVQNMKQLQQASRIAKANQEILRPYKQLLEKQQQAKRSLQDLIVTQGKNSAETRKAQKEYDRLTAKVNLANKATSSFAKTGLGQIARGFRSLLGAFGIVGGIYLFAPFAKQGFELAKKLDSLSFAMRTIITDSNELVQTQYFLLDITEKYGAEIVTTTERYIKFLAAAKQSKITLEDTEQIFRSVTKAAGVLGLSTEELNGTYLALEQMLSKGKVTTEELRRQLGERLPGAFGIMADALGVTIPELDKMLKKGEVLSKDALPKFAQALEKAYNIENVENVKTLQAETNRLSNAWTNFIGNLTKSDGVISKVLMGALSLLTEIVSALNVINTSQEGFNQQLLNSAFLSQSKWYKDLGKEAEAFAEIDKNNAEKKLENLEKEKKAQLDILEKYKESTYIQKIITHEYNEANSALKRINNTIATQEGILKAANKQLGFQVGELEEAVDKGRTLADVLADIAREEQNLKDSTKEEAPAILERIRLLNEEKKAWEDSTKGIKKSVDDRFELQKALLKIELDGLKQIIENEDIALQERLEANVDYVNTMDRLLRLESDHAIKEAGDRTDLVKKIEAETNAQRLDNEKEYQENVKKIKEDALKDVMSRVETSNITISFDESIEKQVIENEFRKKLELEGTTTEKRKEIIDKFNEDVSKAEHEYNLKRLEEAKKIIDEELEDFKGSIDDKKKLYEQLVNIYKGISDEMTAIAIENAEEQDRIEEEKHKKRLERLNQWKELFMTVFDTFSEYYGIDLGKFDFLFDDKKNTVAEWADATKELISSVLDASLKKYDIELQEAQRVRDIIVNNDLATEEEKRVARQKYDEEERKIKTKRAKHERDNTLIQIAVDTAAAVAKVLAQTGVIAPFIIPSIVALGLAQAAFVASQPLPRFEKGTDDAPEGWALVDEKRPEVHLDRRDRVKSFGMDRPNLRYFEKGDKVIPSIDEFLNRYNIDDINKVVWNLNMNSNGNAITPNQMDSAILGEISGMRQDMDAMGKRIERLATRPINNKVTVEIEDKRHY